MYCGLFFITGTHYTYMDKNALRWFFLVCLIIPNMVFLLYWFFNMNVELLKELYGRKLLYFKIATCGLLNPEKFKQKYMLTREEKMK
jgi:hypothetical protein